MKLKNLVFLEKVFLSKIDPNRKLTQLNPAARKLLLRVKNVLDPTYPGTALPKLPDVDSQNFSLQWCRCSSWL